MGMVFLAGSRLAKFFPLLLVAFAGAALLVWMAPYRLRRLATYTDPWADQFGDGYQLTQALIAFGRGGWFGEGLGKSIQKLFFLPEAEVTMTNPVSKSAAATVSSARSNGALSVLRRAIGPTCRVLATELSDVCLLYTSDAADE